MKLLLLTSASKRYPSFETVVITSNGDESLIVDIIEKLTEYYLTRENYQSVSNLHMNISPPKNFVF